LGKQTHHSNKINNDVGGLGLAVGFGFWLKAHGERFKGYR